VSADPGRLPPPDDIGFRSLAAPGLEEDDLLAPIYGPPDAALWGDGRPPALGPDGPLDPAGERRRRHERLLAKWPPSGPEPPARDR
jgi:hypothetical protein